MRELLPVRRTGADHTHTHTHTHTHRAASTTGRGRRSTTRRPGGPRALRVRQAGEGSQPGSQSRPPDRQWPEASDFVARFCFGVAAHASGPVRASQLGPSALRRPSSAVACGNGGGWPASRWMRCRAVGRPLRAAARRAPGASVLVRADSPGAVGFLGRAGRRRGAASLCRRLRAGPWPLGPPAKGVRPVRPLAPSTHGAGPPARKPRHMAGESSPDFSCPRTMGLWQHEVQADTGEWSLHARRIKMSMILCT